MCRCVCGVGVCVYAGGGVVRVCVWGRYICGVFCGPHVL